jgi:hypothetical protein
MGFVHSPKSGIESRVTTSPPDRYTIVTVRYMTQLALRCLIDYDLTTCRNRSPSYIEKAFAQPSIPFHTPGQPKVLRS